MTHLLTATVLALACPACSQASKGAADESAHQRTAERSTAQHVEARAARSAKPARDEGMITSEQDYWRFVAEHEIDADLAYDEADDSR